MYMCLLYILSYPIVSTKHELLEQIEEMTSDKTQLSQEVSMNTSRVTLLAVHFQVSIVFAAPLWPRVHN